MSSPLSAGEAVDQRVNALRPDERTPANLNRAELAFSYEFVDFRCADAERLLRACDSDGERFHLCGLQIGPAQRRSINRTGLFTSLSAPHQR